MAQFDPKDVIGIECKHVAYQTATDGTLNDLLVVKEVVHTKDNGQFPRIRLMENWKRPFYITKPNHRNHSDKKEYEELDKLQKFESTEIGLPQQIQMRLGRRFPNPKLDRRKACDSPYVYYADIRSSTLIKHYYRKRWPNLVSANKVAVLDTERDVIYGTEETILTTVTMGNRRVVGIVKWWADRIPNIHEVIHRKYAEYLETIKIDRSIVDPVSGKSNVKNVEVKLIEERGGDIEILIRDTPGQCIRDVMARTHEMLPDFVAIWNMNYDIKEIIKMLKADNIDPAEVFSDPSVPDQYKYFRYKEADAQRETVSKTISQHPSDLWHVCYCPAGFYIVDAMCLFKKIRVGGGNEPSYALDDILKKYLGVGKLKFKEADHLTKLPWHQFMQKNYPAEYVIYNIFDCVSIELLDDLTGDMASAISTLANISDYSIFPSLPKRLVDILHVFYEERGKVAGTAGSQIITPLDDGVISMNQWIVTLSPYMVYRNGLNIIKEAPKLQTMFRRQVSDSDILQAYPTGQVISNGSKETTAIEIISIEGVSEEARRRAGINLTGGRTNAIEICYDLLNAPHIEDVGDAFMTFLAEQDKPPFEPDLKIAA